MATSPETLLDDPPAETAPDAAPEPSQPSPVVSSITRDYADLLVELAELEGLAAFWRGALADPHMIEWLDAQQAEVNKECLQLKTVPAKDLIRLQVTIQERERMIGLVRGQDHAAALSALRRRIANLEIEYPLILQGDGYELRYSTELGPEAKAETAAAVKETAEEIETQVEEDPERPDASQPFCEECHQPMPQGSKERLCEDCRAAPAAGIRHGKRVR